MPLYEYKCKTCGNVQEILHGISEVIDEVKCQLCDGICEKIFSFSSNFVLKGNDWPSHGSRIKNQMSKKNERMKSKMIEREKSGEGITKI